MVMQLKTIYRQLFKNNCLKAVVQFTKFDLTVGQVDNSTKNNATCSCSKIFLL